MPTTLTQVKEQAVPLIDVNALVAVIGAFSKSLSHMGDCRCILLPKWQHSDNCSNFCWNNWNNLRWQAFKKQNQVASSSNYFTVLQVLVWNRCTTCGWCGWQCPALQPECYTSSKTCCWISEICSPFMTAEWRQTKKHYTLNYWLNSLNLRTVHHLVLAFLTLFFPCSSLGNS